MSLRKPSVGFFPIVIGGYIALLALGAASRAIGSRYTALWPVVIGACVGLLAAGHCSCLIVGFGLVVAHETSVNPLPAFGGAAIGQAITAGRSRTYTLFESGLCVRRSKTINHQFVPRSQLRSANLTADRLAVGRGLPWPFPIRCDRATMADPERVAKELMRLLESAPTVD